MTPFHRSRQEQIDEIRTGCLIRFAQAALLLLAGERGHARAFLDLAIDRMLDLGDYRPGGHYDEHFPGWRDCAVSHRRIAWNRAVSAPKQPAEPAV